MVDLGAGRTLLWAAARIYFWAIWSYLVGTGVWRPPQDAGEPRPVTRGRRLLARLCDWLGLIPGIGWVSWLFAVVCIVRVFVT